MNAYAGIGSRETPDDVLTLMEDAAEALAVAGWTLRSGGADGADIACEKGAKRGDGRREIFLPWEGFNREARRAAGVIPVAAINPDFAYLGPSVKAMEIAAQHHPAWDRLKQGAQKLHGRNVHQVLGMALDEPAEFVLCWTPGALGGGGTGQAIRIAKAHTVPVFDLADAEAYARVEAWLTTPTAA